MNVKSQLTKNDFINAHFILTYKSLPIRILTGFFLLYFLSAIVKLIQVPETSLTGLITSIVLLMLIPLQTYFRANVNFGHSNRLCENLEYSFERDTFSIKGESFNSQLSWNKTYKVTQTKNWILIWDNKRAANPIPKRDFTRAQLVYLKELLNIHLVNNNL